MKKKGKYKGGIKRHGVKDRNPWGKPPIKSPRVTKNSQRGGKNQLGKKKPVRQRDNFWEGMWEGKKGGVHVLWHGGKTKVCFMQKNFDYKQRNYVERGDLRRYSSMRRNPTACRKRKYPEKNGKSDKKERIDNKSTKL